MCTPPPVIAESCVAPALIITTPPSVLIAVLSNTASPTFIVILPPVPFTALPVFISMSPESPHSDAPVVNRSSPLTPLAAESAVVSEMSPLEVEPLLPESKWTSPPRAALAPPPVRLTLPPCAVCEN